MRLLAIAAAALTVATTLAAAPASAQTCQALWVERNQYYKNKGYCFKTQRAIRYFGNAGCWIHNENAVPFLPWERARIDQIRRLERSMRCPV